MNPINLYSALLLLAVVIFFAGFLLLRRGVSLARVAVIVLIGLVLVAGWWFLRPVQTPGTNLATIRSQIGNGTPLLLEFQSPY